MREYSPGASMHDDYAYGCDNCKKMDGRPVLIWKANDLPGKNRDHFSLCFECLSNLYFEFAVDTDKTGESIIVKRASIPEKVRNQIFKKDEFMCVKCGSKEFLTIDHIIPFSKGGKTSPENLQTLCRSCNLSKGSRT